MIWQNPWAWAGLVLLALPVLIHLLGRGEARRRVFPTLRFLPPSRALPTRRRRIRDPLLLAVRLGILASAVIALAQPYLVTAKRRRDFTRGISRAIIVDTSESMRRPGAGGARPLDKARADAERLAGEAQTSLVIQTAIPRRALVGAVSWIARQQRRAELVIVSDFQTETVDARDLAVVPRTVGIRPSRVDAVPGPNAIVTQAGDIESSARVSLTPMGSSVEWTMRAEPATPLSNILILAGANERSSAETAQRAAATLGARPPSDSTHRVAIVFRGYERRSEMLRSATPLHTPWMADLVARLRADSMLTSASADAVVNANSGDTTSMLAVARTDSGSPAVTAVQGSVEGREHLLLISFVDASSVASAALIAATSRALSGESPPNEMEPTTIPDSVLRSWLREPDVNAAPRANGDGGSDGRWLWIVALALLGLESWLRRTRREEVMSNMVHDRAA